MRVAMRLISKNMITYSWFCLSIFIADIANANSNTTKTQTDLIIYSYDRPMQLYALLESIDKYVTGLEHILIIYRTSNQEYEKAYHVVRETFTNAHFLQQTYPFTDLKRLTSACYLQSSSPYILFGVDDIIVKDFINLNECIQAMEQHNAHGFFFRLGKNLDHCYAMNCAQPLPPLTSAGHEIYSWQFNEGQYDWNYPNNLDFTLYRKSDLINLITSLDYATPYSLETKLMGQVDYTQHGLCYESSKIVNFPLNIVQTDWPNNCDNTYSTSQLLELFNQGLKIDIKAIDKIDNKSAHTINNNLIKFIPRKPLDEKLIVIVTPSYNNKEWWEWNLKSLLNQDYHNYYIIITDDCSTDGTGDSIENYIKTNNLEGKVKLIKNNERRGALHNLYTMIHSCPNEALIATVDGDDALADPTVLKKLNHIYSTQDVWLTYGQFMEHPSGTKGWCTPMPTDIVKNNAFREHEHIPSHLRTFYAWLFKSIKLEDMLYNGEFYKMTWDYAIMLPMIEMAGERHLCIQDQILYIYNNANSISDHKISRQLQAHLAQIVRAKNRYQRLPSKQEDLGQNLEHKKADVILFAEECNPNMLDLCLSSMEKNITGLGQIYVLYLSLPTTIQQYAVVKEKHPTIAFLEIDEKRTNFKNLLSEIYQNYLQNNYVIFALPTMRIEQPINLTQCIKALEKTQAYAFSLKLSKENPCNPIPARMALLEIEDDVCAWDYATANDVWACANNVDMTLYHRNNQNLTHILEHYWMFSWVHVVGWWAHEGNLNKVGLCFKYPKIKEIN